MNSDHSEPPIDDEHDWPVAPPMHGRLICPHCRSELDVEGNEEPFPCPECGGEIDAARIGWVETKAPLKEEFSYPDEGFLGIARDAIRKSVVALTVLGTLVALLGGWAYAQSVWLSAPRGFPDSDEAACIAWRGAFLQFALGAAAIVGVMIGLLLIFYWLIQWELTDRIRQAEMEYEREK